MLLVVSPNHAFYRKISYLDFCWGEGEGERRRREGGKKGGKEGGKGGEGGERGSAFGGIPNHVLYMED